MSGAATIRAIYDANGHLVSLEKEMGNWNDAMPAIQLWNRKHEEELMKKKKIRVTLWNGRSSSFCTRHLLGNSKVTARINISC